MKMYSGENSGGTSNRSAANKDTLHISPHIAAHKSTGSSQPNGQLDIGNVQKQDDFNSRLAPIQTFAGHIPGYRVGIPTSTVFSEQFQHSVRSQSAHLQVPTIFTLPSSKTLPQDLSAHTSKVAVTGANNDSTQKALPHIHSVSGQNLENLSGPLIVPVSDRCPAYYRLVDGTTISISSQHPAMLVSSRNDDPSTIQHSSHVDSVRQNQHGETHSVPSSSISASMPLNSFTGTVASHQHGNTSGLSEGHVYIVPQELPGGNFMPSPDTIIPDREMRNTQIDGIKEEIGEHKDLVHQALQAAVVQNSNKSGSAQDPIEYDYGTENLGGSSEDCLVHDDIICHSTFCSQPTVKTPQGELLLMNINMSPGHANANKSGGAVIVGSNVNESSSGGQVVVLEPASAMDEAGNLLSPIIVSSRRRRTRLTEEAQAQRREKIANRMREKRANETEEQKEKRRMREAERMRRKRAQEDETSKERRRREAAERARLRRARLSNEERELERKKAAARMRLRRQNENEEQKRQRRIKAAERMRKRRSTETPEERATRKQNIAMRMKLKRLKKEDKDEKLEAETSSLDSSILTSEDDKKTSDRDKDSSAILPETNGQYTSASHIVVTSSVAGVPSGLALLHSDPPPDTNAQLLQGAIISAVELAHVAQPLSLQVRSTSPSNAQRSPNSERSSQSQHKSVTLPPQDVATSSPQETQPQVQTKSTDSPSVLTKTSSNTTTTSSSSLSSHHHLPHLLHHLTPHQDQHHHTQYVLSHQNQHPHQHQQSQPLQFRHQ